MDTRGESPASFRHRGCQPIAGPQPPLEHTVAVDVAAAIVPFVVVVFLAVAITRWSWCDQSWMR